MRPHLYGMCSSASKTPLLWESPNQYQSIKGVRIHETTFLYEQGGMCSSASKALLLLGTFEMGLQKQS